MIYQISIHRNTVRLPLSTCIQINHFFVEQTLPQVGQRRLLIGADAANPAYPGFMEA